MFKIGERPKTKHFASEIGKTNLMQLIFCYLYKKKKRVKKLNLSYNRCSKKPQNDPPYQLKF
jgi:hypothetical protein